MPSTSYSIALTTGQVQDVQRLEQGILESVMLIPETTGLGQAEAYAELYLCVTDTPTPVPVAILTSGYLGASHAIGWTGAIQMEPAFAILTRIWCAQNFTFRLSFIVQTET